MVAAADPRFVGCESFRGQPDPADWQPNLPTNCRDRWEALRLSDAACFLALAAPRHLLRTPYGKGNDPIELCPFDELPATGGHEFLLWGNPAQAKAPLIGPTHTILTAAHPSPLSATRGFFGSRPFSRTNAALRQAGRTEIGWRL